MGLNLRLISRLIGLNALTYSGGEFRIWGVAMVFFPYKATAHIQHELDKKYGKKARDGLYYVGKIQAYIGTQLIRKKFGIKVADNMYDLFADQAAMVGEGLLRGDKIDGTEKYSLMTSTSNPYMQEYIKLYGKEKKSSDHYLRGLVAGATEGLFGGDIVAIETKCINKDDDVCTFESKERSKWDLKDPVVKEQMPEDVLNFSEITKKLELTTLVKQTTGYGQIISNFFKEKKAQYDESGRFFLLGKEGMSIQMDTCVLFVDSFTKLFKKDAQQVLTEAGAKAADIFLSDAPQNMNLVQLNQFLKNMQYLGMGLIEVTKCDDKAEVCQIKVTNHNYAKHYVKIFGMQKEPNDAYLAGFINRCLEIFHKKELATIEKQCIMQGKSEFCYFESRPKK